MKIEKAPHKKSNSSDAKEEKPKVSEKSNIGNFFAKQAAKPKVEKTEIKAKSFSKKSLKKKSLRGNLSV